MIELLPKQLWLGTAMDLWQPKQLFDHEIAAVVDLALEEPAIALPRQLIHLRIPLNDGQGNPPESLRLAIESVVRLLSLRLNTLVTCSAGMSRSPTITAFALAKYKGQDPHEVVRKIGEQKGLEIKGTFWNAVAEAASLD